MIGVAPAAVREVLANVPPPTPAPAASPTEDYGEIDLPTVGGAPPASAGKAVPRAPVPRPGGAPPRPPPRVEAKPTAPSNIDLPAPVVPKAAPAAPAPRPSPSPSGGFALDDFDLPAPRAVAAPSAPLDTSGLDDMELDLGGDDGELPMVRNAGGSTFDLDLPAVGERMPPPPPAFDALDLPSPRPAEPDDFDFDLPSLPDMGGVDAAFGELDLPSPGGIGLPAPGGIGLPAPGGIGLPAPGGAGLPAPARAGDLPTAVRGELPARPGGRSVFELDSPSEPEDDFALEPPRAPAPSPYGATAPIDHGSSFGDRFGEISLPGEEADFSSPAPAAPAAPRQQALPSDPFGAAELPPPNSFTAADPDRNMAATVQASSAEITRAGGGGVSYGEVNLDGGGGPEVPIEAPTQPRLSGRPAEEEMEFGGVPQEAVAQAPGRVAVPNLEALQPRRRRLGVKIFAALFVIAVGGAALALVPEVGPFGAYWIADQLKADEYARLLSATVDSSRRSLGRDTAGEAQKAAATAESAQQRAKRVVGLKAYAAFVGYARELRFGVDAPVRARAKVLLDELAEVESAPYLDLARAARAAALGELPRAATMVQALESKSPRDPDVLVLKGELLLRQADPKAASVAWEAAGKVENSARTAYGLARAKFAAGDRAGAEKAARQAIERNAEHVGARILLARVLAPNRNTEAAALELLEGVIKDTSHASSQEIVAAQTKLGDMHLARSRISLAQGAYNAALKIDPKSARALVGLGEATFRAGRYSDALARFEAALQAAPKDIDAAVGVAKSKLLLERSDDALQSLKKLSASSPKSIPVAYWYGRTLESLGSREPAAAVYSAAIKLPTKDPAIIDVYVALALLQNQLGNQAQAKATLQAAAAALPGSPAVPRAFGEIALSESRSADAAAEFQKALAIDAQDLEARFKLGISQRRQNQFEEASKSFDQVAAVDKEYPGLALERGLLFEATGRGEDALKSYESALAKAPTDPDLMLRVGCGKVSSGLGQQAEPLLRKVMALRPNSAEPNHCLGRSLLAQNRLADAGKLLDRAVELDPNRAEFHLYMGWAASDAGNLVKAEKALDQALKLDQGMADAYWQRGVLRQRQGMVRDAITDLRKALELRPSRQEVHAALAAALYDFGKEAEALAEWALAVKAQPDNALWRFRYGRLLVQNQMSAQALEQLKIAIELGEKQTPAPRWLWEAHQSMARAHGETPAAIEHWEAFLRLGPQNSPYRGEAKAALKRLDKPWSGN
jgi:cellulose synthase operon protein C